MKRPIALYFVAAWCFLAIDLEMAVAISCFLPGEIIKEQWQLWTLFLVPLPAAVWLVTELIRLKRIPRWVCVASLACLTAASVIFVYTILHAKWNYWIEGLTYSQMEEHRRNEKLKLIVEPILIAALSALSIWYLSRRSFREFARQFVEERQKRG